MIQSMTGYGKAVVAYKDKKINVEVKSLNSKQLDLQTRIAPLYREKEMEVRQMTSEVLIRGKVDLSIWIEKDTLVNATPVNGALMENYYHQLKDIAHQTGIPEPQDWLYTLTRMPDVLTKTDCEVLEDEEWVVVRQGLNEALQSLVAFRQQEGAALERKFNEKIDNIERLLHDIEPWEKQRVEKIRGRIIDGLKQIPEADYDKNRLEQELIYYIEKLDISEEKQRLTNHLRYFRETMAEPLGGQGKKLGFIAQEMGREINTTGSKSNQAEMQNIVVKMKDELEQIKEQVLNAL
ncbi:MAG: YicC family protein [Prevotella sp.]|nr:YicC family protein [Prevotella sp.]